MIRGITFDKQLMKSKDHAHEVNYYYSGDLGVTKGCVPSVNASNDIVVTEGYFIIKGRLISIEGSETIDVPTVPSGTLYSVLVFEIDLTKTNTTTVFNQGAFKILSNASAYPTPTQQDLDNGGTLYQFEFARFENTVGGLVNFSDTRVVLNMSKYALKDSPTFTGTVSGITKAMVGLGNVDNTSDVNKPISNATQTALDTKAILASYTATIPSASWTGSSAPFSKAVTVSGILSTDIPIIDIVQTGTYATDQAMVTNWALIYRAVTSSNTITFYATAVPSADISIQVKVVR